MALCIIKEFSMFRSSLPDLILKTLGTVFHRARLLMKFMNGSGPCHGTRTRGVAVMVHGFPEPGGYSVLVTSVSQRWSIDIVFGSSMG